MKFLNQALNSHNNQQEHKGPVQAFIIKFTDGNLPMQDIPIAILYLLVKGLLYIHMYTTLYFFAFFSIFKKK